MRHLAAFHETHNINRQPNRGFTFNMNACFETGFIRMISLFLSKITGRSVSFV